MEFLYFSHKSLEDRQATNIFNAKRISYRRAKNVVKFSSGVIVTNARVVVRGSRQYCFMGSAFTNRGFFNNFSELSDFDIVNLCETALNNSAAINGTYICIIGDGETSGTDFIIDNLNAAPCFFVKNNSCHAISNNPHMLADWLIERGQTPRRSIDPFLSDAVFASGLTVGSVYEGVRAVNPGTRLKVRKRLLEVIANDQVWPGLLSLSYDELIEAAAARIKARMVILTNAPENVSKVFDLTGGMDSRIILAALVGSKTIDQWSFNTLFDAPNPDGNFAQHVGERLGLRRMLLGANQRKVGLWTENRLQLFHSFGTENKRGFYPNYYQPDLLRVHGGFGELGGKNQDTKRFTRVPLDSEDFTSFTASYLQAVSDITESVGFSREVLSWAEAHLGPEIEASTSDQVPEELMANVFYSRGKARSHYGMISHLRSFRLQYPDVLNDPYITAAALKLGPFASKLGKVNFDLIRTLGGDEIAAMPLVLGRWRKQIFDSWEDVRKFSKPGIQVSTERMFGKHCETIQSPVHLEEPTLDEIWEPEPDKRLSIGRAVPRKALIGNLSVIAQRLLNDAPMSEEVARFLPESAVRVVLDGDVADLDPNTANLNIVRFFTQSEMWMRGLEQTYYSE